MIIGLLYAADTPPTPIMSYYSLLNVSLHFEVCVIFPGGGGQLTPLAPTWLRPWPHVKLACFNFITKGLKLEVITSLTPKLYFTITEQQFRFYCYTIFVRYAGTYTKNDKRKHSTRHNKACCARSYFGKSCKGCG